MGEADLVGSPGTGGSKALQTSLIYQVLPAMVQNHIPTLPSLRRSVSDFHTRGLHVKNKSITEMSLPETPPPGYTSRSGSGSTTPTSSMDIPDDGLDAALSSGTSTPTPLVALYETSTGVNWQYARHGVVIMNQTHEQSSTPCYTKDDIMTAIIRSQYIHSVTLFLRSLPSTLTSAEKLSLLAAIPQNVLDAQASQYTHTLTRTTQVGLVSPGESRVTLLSRVTTWLVFRLVLLLQFLLPFVRRFLGHATQFEHEHQITKRAFNAGVSFGSRFCGICTRVLHEVNDGAVGEALSSATVYCAESIGEGVKQGISDALHAQEGRERGKRIEKIA